MSDPLDPRYRQNPDYKAQHDGTFWLLSDAGGWGLACDALVYRVWSGFDGSPTSQAVPAVSREAGVSAAFVESTAKVLARAGMLLPSRPLQPLARLPAAAQTLQAADGSDLELCPLVSVIILASREARAHLETCLPSIQAQTYPNLEVILVDNQTTDGSVAFVKERFPSVKVLSTQQNLGFGGANNLAMRQARGEFFFLLNEDTEMEPDCVAEAVRVMLRSEKIAAVAPKMRLFYMRAFFNSMGNSIHANGQSHDNFIGYLDVGQFDGTNQVFTACFGAAMLRRSVVEQIGDMDEAYFVYYDDTDWSFRARLCGYEVVAAPRSVVYHKFNATVNTMASTFKLGLIIHNRLRYAWKNFDLRRAIRFLWLYLKGDLGGYLWARQQGMSDVADTFRQSRLRWMRSWPEVTRARWQTRRLRQPPFSDDAVFELAAGVPPPAIYGRYPVISAPLVRNHYMKLEIFAPSTCSAPTASATHEPPAQAGAGLWACARKAWQTARGHGLRGLAREGRNYLLWRLSPK